MKNLLFLFELSKLGCSLILHLLTFRWTIAHTGTVTAFAVVIGAPLVVFKSPIGDLIWLLLK